MPSNGTVTGESQIETRVRKTEENSMGVMPAAIASGN